MRIELTHKNHFQFGYNDNPFVFRKESSDQWYVKYGVCKRKPMSFKDECLETATLIRKSTSEDLFVMFSGGVDSEVVLRAFVENGLKVQAALLRFEDNLNEHDLYWALKACHRFGVPFRYFDLNLRQFWTQSYNLYSDPTYCVSPQLLPTMWLIDQIPGYPIMGSGECFLARTDAPDPQDPPRPTYPPADWEMYEREKIAAWYRHFMIRERSGCPGFFQYTPEIMLSYLIDPFVSKLCTNQIYGKYSTASSKLVIYQSHFPDLESRPKYTGYEKVQTEDAELRKKLFESYPGCNQIHKSNYHTLVQHLADHRL